MRKTTISRFGWNPDEKSISPLVRSECPSPSALVAGIEEQGEMVSGVRFGNQRTPPGEPPLIGDGVAHDALGFSPGFEAMLMDEVRKRPFDDLIFEYLPA
jgi:hypothetical protein